MNKMTVEIVNGRKVGVRLSGQGAPALMIHCALAHSGAFSPLMKGLDDTLAMTAFDLPGHGQTGFDKANDIHDQAVEISIALLERFDQPSTVIGHSFGATVALRLMVERPDLVAAVFLYEPVYFSILHRANPAAYAREAQDSEPLISAAVLGNWPDAARVFLKRWSGEDFDAIPQAKQAYILKTLPLIINGNPSNVDPEKGGKLWRQLLQVKLPVVLMAGENSPKVVHHIIDAIGANVPHAKSFVLAGAGHMGPLTHALDVAKILKGNLPSAP